MTRFLRMASVAGRSGVDVGTCVLRRASQRGSDQKAETAVGGVEWAQGPSSNLNSDAGEGRAGNSKRQSTVGLVWGARRLIGQPDGDANVAIPAECTGEAEEHRQHDTEDDQKPVQARWTTQQSLPKPQVTLHEHIPPGVPAVCRRDARPRHDSADCDRVSCGGNLDWAAQASAGDERRPDHGCRRLLHRRDGAGAGGACGRSGAGRRRVGLPAVVEVLQPPQDHREPA